MRLGMVGGNPHARTLQVCSQQGGTARSMPALHRAEVPADVAYSLGVLLERREREGKAEYSLRSAHGSAEWGARKAVSWFLGEAQCACSHHLSSDRL